MRLMDLLNAEHVGVRELKTHLSAYLHKKKPIITTETGKPVNVLVKYRDLIGILQLLQQLSDEKLSGILAQGRKSIEKGAVGISALESLRKLKLQGHNL